MKLFPPRTIAVAFDGSQPSYSALEAARTIASRFGSAMELICVEELVPVAPGLAASSPRCRRGSIEGLAGAAMEVFKGNWSLRVPVGRAIPEILRRAVPSVAQLLVTGTHAREGGERFLLGSTAEALVHRSKIPVLAVRAGGAFAPRKILAPFNLTGYADEALLYAADLADAFSSELTALYAPQSPQWEIDADDELRRALERRLGQRSASVRRVIAYGEARHEISAAAESGRYDLLVLSAHHRSQLSDLALGTTAERMLRSCPVPLLAVPERRRRSAQP